MVARPTRGFRSYLDCAVADSFCSCSGALLSRRPAWETLRLTTGASSCEGEAFTPVLLLCPNNPQPRAWRMRQSTRQKAAINLTRTKCSYIREFVGGTPCRCPPGTMTDENSLWRLPNDSSATSVHHASVPTTLCEEQQREHAPRSSWEQVEDSRCGRFEDKYGHPMGGADAVALYELNAEYWYAGTGWQA